MEKFPTSLGSLGLAESPFLSLANKYSLVESLLMCCCSVEDLSDIVCLNHLQKKLSSKAGSRDLMVTLTFEEMHDFMPNKRLGERDTDGDATR